MLKKVTRDDISNIVNFKPIHGIYDDGKMKFRCSIVGTLPVDIFGDKVVTINSDKDKVWTNVFYTKDILNNFYVVV